MHLKKNGFRTNSSIDENVNCKAQIDFQKQMLVQQERFEALVIQQTTDNRLFCETILSQKTNDNASRFFFGGGYS